MKIRQLSIRLLIGLIVFLVPVFSVVKINEFTLKNDVTKYLIDRGYSNDDIVSINTYLGKAPLFSARVIFSDEKNIIYYYMKDHDKIRQFGTPTDLDADEPSDGYHLKHFETKQ